MNCENSNIIDYLPHGIEELVLKSNFNLELNNLPNSIKKIVFKNEDYNQKLNCLPNSIELIELPIEYKLKMDKISNNLKKIKCSKNYEFITDFVNIEIDYYYSY